MYCLNVALEVMDNACLKKVESEKEFLGKFLDGQKLSKKLSEMKIDTY